MRNVGLNVGGVWEKRGFRNPSVPNEGEAEIRG